MPEGHTFFLFLVMMVQMLTGILANGFIMVVNTIDMVTQRKLVPLDLLLSCLATSRFILQFCILFAQLGIFCLANHSIFTYNITFVFFINELGLWFATWLGVFYCAKIATIPHPLFLWLKMRISRLIPSLILGSVLYATFIAVVLGGEALIIPKQIFVTFFFKNSTQVTPIPAMPLSVFILGFTLPSFIFVVAVLLLIFSLCSHSWKMRTMRGPQEPCRHGHISAMFSILSFLILYFSHYMVALVVSTQGFHLESTAFLFCGLMIGIYPSLHSVILVLGNPKLKKNAKMFIVHCKCCCCVRA